MRNWFGSDSHAGGTEVDLAGTQKWAAGRVLRMMQHIRSTEYAARSRQRDLQENRKPSLRVGYFGAGSRLTSQQGAWVSRRWSAEAQSGNAIPKLIAVYRFDRRRPLCKTSNAKLRVEITKVRNLLVLQTQTLTKDAMPLGPVRTGSKKRRSKAFPFSLTSSDTHK